MSVVQTQQYFVAINPTLVKHFKSLTVAAIFERAEYWFSKKENQFYKFIEPCNHPCYREGDSWCEELGITRKVFKKAFELIGTRYISKTQFDLEKDPFKGKFFAYYFDRKSNKTIFVRNNKAIHDFFEQIKNKVASLSFKKEIIKEVNPQSILSTDNASNSIHESSRIRNNKGRSCIAPLGQSYAGATKEISNNTSLKLIDQKNLNEVLEGVEISPLEDQMIDIWNEVTEQKVTIPKKTMQGLPNVLKTLFKNSIEEWKSYCRKVASSKFLMGEGSNKDFKIRLGWAVQDHTVERVKSGEFGCDRIVPFDRERNKKIGELRRQKESLTRDLDNLENDMNRKCLGATRNMLSAFSTQRRTQLENEFKEKIEKEDTLFSKEFLLKGWKAQFSQIFFEGFVQNKIFGEVDQMPEYINAKAERELRLGGIETDLKMISQSRPSN